jgi:hypothetical protein
MATDWTPERRAQQAERIRQSRPWEKSTGPRTEAGKARSARNADKGGRWRIERERVRVLARMLAELQRTMRAQRKADRST